MPFYVVDKNVPTINTPNNSLVEFRSHLIEIQQNNAMGVSARDVPIERIKVYVNNSKVELTDQAKHLLYQFLAEVQK
jgi:hypothetical protein